MILKTKIDSSIIKLITKEDCLVLLYLRQRVVLRITGLGQTFKRNLKNLSIMQ